MKPAALVTLNMRELDRLKVIQALADGASAATRR
jgi:hypothetical protein